MTLAVPSSFAPALADITVKILDAPPPVPDGFVLAVAGIVGLLVGSFLNVVIYRLPRNCLSIVRPGSRCPACKTPIRWYDNIPVVSWVVLNGACRSCKSKISMRYPFVEALTGGLFVLIVWMSVVRPGLIDDPFAWLTALTQIVFVSLLIAGGLIDADLTVIPDRITLGGTAVILLLALANPFHGGMYQPRDEVEIRTVVVDGQTMDVRQPLAYHGHYALVAHQPPGTAVHDHVTNDHLRSFLGALFGALIAGGTMLLLRTLATGLLIRKALRYGQGAAMGMGDVKLMLLFGAMLGWPGALLSIFGGALIGIVVTLPMMVRKGQHLFPFGPFLAAAAIVLMLFYGDILHAIIDLYAPMLGPIG